MTRKPICDQNLFNRFQSWCSTAAQKINTTDQAFLEIFYVKNQALWLAKKTLGPKLKNQSVKLLERTESICCFWGKLLICKKSALKLNSILKYCIFNIGNSIWHAQVHLTRFIWMNWITLMYLSTNNHKQKINFIPKFILEISLIYCFGSLWACLTKTTWNVGINLLPLCIPN